MVKKQMNRQESETANLQQITSNTVPLFLSPVLWFQISWVYLIIMSLIMVVLRFTLQIFELNLTLNNFQIQTPLFLYQLMHMKWTISRNYFINTMMKTF